MLGLLKKLIHKIQVPILFKRLKLSYEILVIQKAFQENFQNLIR